MRREAVRAKILSFTQRSESPEVESFGTSDLEVDMRGRSRKDQEDCVRVLNGYKIF